MKTRRTLVSTVLVALTLVLFAATGSQAVDVESITIWYGVDRVNSASPDFFCDIGVKGTGITDVLALDTTSATWMALTYNGTTDRWEYGDDGYGSLPAFSAVHGNPAQYYFYINQGPGPSWESTSSPYFSIAPPGVAPAITYPLHDATAVPVDPTYMWTSLSGAPGVNYLDLWVEDDNGETVYEFGPSAATAMTAWTPGVLDYGTHYLFGVGAKNLQSTAGLPTTDAGNPNDTYVFYEIWEQGNSHGFTTETSGAVPEPMSLALFASGTVVVGYVGWRRRRRMR